MKRLILALFFIGQCLLSNATTYYFSLAGNDGNDGLTTATSWRTITKFNSIMSSKIAGDVFLFKRGDVFAGNMVIAKSGTALAPFTIGAYGSGANPQILGLTAVTAWTSLGANVWESTSSVSTLTTMNTVVINGVDMPMGRVPQTGYYTNTSNSTTILTSSSLNASTINWTGATVVIRKSLSSSTNCLVTSATSNTINYTDPIQSTSAAGANFGFFFENDARTLSNTINPSVVQGAWYYNPSTKKIRIYSTTSPTGVQVATVNNLVATASFSDILFTGLDFIGANNDAFLISGSRIRIKNCNINYAGSYAVEILAGGTDSVVNCTIDHSGKGGLYVNSASPYFGYNRISHSGVIKGKSPWDNRNMGIFIDASASNALSSHNYILATGCHGIAMKPLICRSEFDVVDSAILVNNDNGAFYSNGTGTYRVYYHDMAMHSYGEDAGTPNPGFHRAVGFYLDESCTHTEIIGCTSVNSFTNGIKIHISFNNKIDSCTIFNVGNDNAPGLLRIQGGSETVADTLTNNIFFANTANNSSAQQWVYDISSSGSISSMGVIDNNYLVSSVSTGLISTINGTNRNYAAYQTFANPADSHSHATPIPVTNVGLLNLYINPTDHDSITNVVTGVDARNTSYSGTSTLHPGASLVIISSGSLIVPTITWANPSAITYGTALSGTQLNATSGGVSGTHSYSITLGTVLHPGTYTIVDTFTPTDGATYTTVTKSVTLVVNPATATMAFSNLTLAYTGSGLTPTVTTSPGSLAIVTLLFNGVSTLPINPGTYTVTAGLVNSDYTASPISATFTITKGTATINVSNTTFTYNTLQHGATITTTPSGLSGLTILYNGSATLPTNTSAYTLTVTLTNSIYNATPISTTFIINQATPIITWPNPASIVYGTALSGTQLNASANTAGVFTYNPASGTIFTAGSHTISTNFVPTDNTNYKTINNTTVPITVTQATATINVSNYAQNYDGTAKPVTTSTSPVGLSGLVVLYNGVTTVPINPGSYSVSVNLTNANYTATTVTGTLVISVTSVSIFITNTNQIYDGSPKPVTVTTTPPGLTDSVVYNGSLTVPTAAGTYVVRAFITDGIHSGSDTQTLVIAKATPPIIWANPGNISYGTVLSSTQLNATSTVAGTKVYSPAAGTTLNVGTQSIMVTLTPTDGANYNVATKTVQITVVNNTATITVSNLNQTYDGTAKSVIVVTSPSGLGTLTILYNGVTTVPSAAGVYAVSVTLANANYIATPFVGTLTIAKGSASISWSTPIAINYGSALSMTQLNATSATAGVITYNPPIGTIPLPGTIALTATLIPTNINISTVTATVNLVVNGNPFINWWLKHHKTTVAPGH